MDGGTGAPSTSADTPLVSEPDEVAFEGEETTGTGPTGDDEATHGGNLEDDLFGDEVGEAEALASEEGQDHIAEEALKEVEDQKPDYQEKPAEDQDTEITQEEAERRRQLEYLEEENEVIVTRERVIAEAALANLPVPRPTDGKHWEFRIPAFLEVEETVFDEANFVKDDEYDPNIALPDENVMRWQWKEDEYGQRRKVSNARIVRWSDGSQSLQVGAELFDLVYQIDQSATLPSRGPPTQTDPASASALHAASLSSAPHPSTATTSHSLTYLFAQHDYARLLEAQAAMTGSIVVRPAGLSSATHRVLAARAQNKHSAASRTRRTVLTDVAVDPERQKADQGAEELKRAKEAKKAARKTAGGGGGGERGVRRRKFNARLFSDDEGGGLGDEDAEGDPDDDHGAGGAGTHGTPRRNPKRGRDGVYEDAEDDGFVVPDSSDSEASGGSPGGKNRQANKGRSWDARGGGAAPPLDDLEEAELRLEGESKRKKAKIRDAERKSDEIKAEQEEEERREKGRKRMVIESDDED